VEITIRDHGAGMSDELLQRAFEPFVREDTSKSSGDGAGIGLAIAKAQGAASGAIVSLDNHPEGGMMARHIISDGGA
jgi:C4-dicarboxylate-specific signal transduction histidine kinase